MKLIKYSVLRTLCIFLFLALSFVGLAYHTGTGTLSAWGYGTISAICPLGGIEAMLASKTLIPVVFISLAVFLVIAIVFGRVFCAWMCPVPLFRRWFPKKATIEKERQKRDTKEMNASSSKIDASYYILGGALGSTALFGFPVFCLICPVGLTFAVIVSVWRLIQFNEPTWSLMIFPLILALELMLFRFTCKTVCPLGALVSLMSRLNLFFKPQIDKESCLKASRGAECNLCQKVCHEDIDLHEPLTQESLSRCTKCSDCSDACPMKAISFSFFKKKSS